MASSYKGILHRYEICSSRIQQHFDALPDLLKDGYSYEVSLAYLFLRVEKAQNSALYCGVVKLHHANATVASRAVNAQYLTRDGFLRLYKNIFASPLPKKLRKRIEGAETIRDRVIHGKAVSDAEMRTAHVDVLEFAELLNSELDDVAGIQPFGDLRGFKGRGVGLDNETSRWLLKGLGFAIA